MQCFQFTPLTLGSIVVSASIMGIAPLPKLSRKRMDVGPVPDGHKENRDRDNICS